MTKHMKQSDKEIAKEIIGKWGYEEEYWWKPIAEAIDQARKEGREEVIKEIPVVVIERVIAQLHLQLTNLEYESQGLQDYNKIKTWLSQLQSKDKDE